MQVRGWPPREAKACLFDFGGTLDADGIPWQDRFYALYEKHEVPVDREAFRLAFYEADDELTDSGALLGAGLSETIRIQAERVWKHLGFAGQDRSTLEAIAADFQRDLRGHVGRNRALLVRLRSRYALGIVSNFYGNLDRVCEDLGIRDLFACRVDSYQVGVLKPDPRIFRTALDRLGLRPVEAIFVGDNPVRDMEGAKRLGMPHVWLAGTGGQGRRPCCPGDPVLSSLDELGGLLLPGSREALREGAVP